MHYPIIPLPLEVKFHSFGIPSLETSLHPLEISHLQTFSHIDDANLLKSKNPFQLNYYPILIILFRYDSVLNFHAFGLD